MRQANFIRPSRLFTTDSAIVLYRAGAISEANQAVVVAALVDPLGFSRWAYQRQFAG